MKVKALSRGQVIDRIIDPDTGIKHECHRIIERDTEFECPDDQLALISIGLSGEQLGWMVPIDKEDLLAHRDSLRSPAPANPIPCADGLWPVGHHSSYDMSRRIPVSNDAISDLPPEAA